MMPVPAFNMKKSSRPKRSSIVRNIDSMSSASSRSVRIEIVLTPCCIMAATVSRAASSSESWLMIGIAPRAARDRASLRPTPCVPDVTRATLAPKTVPGRGFEGAHRAGVVSGAASLGGRRSEHLADLGESLVLDQRLTTERHQNQFIDTGFDLGLKLFSDVFRRSERRPPFDDLQRQLVLTLEVFGRLTAGAFEIVVHVHEDQQSHRRLGAA